MRQVYAHLATADGTPRLDLPVPHAIRQDGPRLRILFAAEPGRVDEIRQLIDTLPGLTDTACTRLDPSDRDAARQLLRSCRTPGLGFPA